MCGALRGGPDEGCRSSTGTHRLLYPVWVSPFLDLGNIIIDGKLQRNNLLAISNIEKHTTLDERETKHGAQFDRQKPSFQYGADHAGLVPAEGVFNILIGNFNIG